MCEPLQSNCKMHLIIVYSDTKAATMLSPIFDHETAASATTILKHYVVSVLSLHSRFQGCFLKKTRVFYIQLSGKCLSAKAYAELLN